LPPLPVHPAMQEYASSIRRRMRIGYRSFIVAS
jgi:hypothetical protein